MAAFSGKSKGFRLGEDFVNLADSPYAQVASAAQNLLSTTLTKPVAEALQANMAALTRPPVENLLSTTLTKPVAEALQANMAALARPILWQFARGDGIAALYRGALADLAASRVLDERTSGTPLSEHFTRLKVEDPNEFDDISDGHQTPVAAQTSENAVPRWLAWERRYNQELVLLIALLSLIVAIAAFLETRPAEGPSGADYKMRSAVHDCHGDVPRRQMAPRPSSEPKQAHPRRAR